jgi:hypothetical protein
VTCSICNIRKEKRFCPAAGERICAQCCGEQREVTLDCPSECIYLKQAREHEKPHSLADLDRSALFPQVELGENFLYQQEHLVLGLSFALVRAARSERGIADRDLIAALANLAKSYETLANSGLIYETPVANVARQSVIEEVQRMVKEYRDTEAKQFGHSALRDSEVLAALVFLLRMAYGRTSGRPKSRAFLDFLSAQFPEKSSVLATPEEAGSRIVLP